MNNIQAFCIGSDITCMILSIANAIENKTNFSYITLGIVAVFTIATIVLNTKRRTR